MHTWKCFTILNYALLQSLYFGAVLIPARTAWTAGAAEPIPGADGTAKDEVSKASYFQELPQHSHLVGAPSAQRCPGELRLSTARFSIEAVSERTIAPC